MLTDEQIAALCKLPRDEAAMRLLRGTTGPLADIGVEYGLHESWMAYLIALAWTAGRRASVLGGKPGWEAREILASRVRSCATRAVDLGDFGSLLFRSVGCRIESLKQADALWWLKAKQLADGRAWRLMRQRRVLEDAISASGMLNEWLWAIHEGASK